jgi:predicted MFS family arabinose efflux permease
MAAISITGVMGNTLITAAIPDIRDDFGVGSFAAGLLIAATAFPGILMAPLIGLLADRFGRREVVVPCLVVFGASGGMAAFAPSFAVLLGLRFVQGMGAAGLLNLAVVIIGDNWEGAERTRLIGRNAAALLAGIVVLPPLGGVLADQWGWRATFVPYWIALVVAAATLALLRRSPRGSSSFRDQLRATAPYLRSWSVLGPVITAFAAFALIFGLFLTVMPVYLKDHFGVDAGGRGLVLALPAMTSTCGALLLARLTARSGLARVLRLASILWVVAFSLLAGAPALVLVGLATLIYGFGEGILIPTLQDAVASAAPASSRGSTVALFVAFARAGQTVGPLLAGAVLTAGGARAAFGGGAAIAVLLAVFQRRLLGTVGQEVQVAGANPILAAPTPDR